MEISTNANTETVCKPSVAKTMRHEMVHFGAALILSFIIHFYFQNLLLTFWTFALCMLLDGDHLFDYGLYTLKYKKRFSLKEFLSGSYFAEWKKFIMPLHSWELAFVFFILSFVINFQIPFFLASSLAFTVHYTVDYFTNDVNKKAYFILYRAKYKFVKRVIAKDFDLKEEDAK